jgi:hypothetical protein
MQNLAQNASFAQTIFYEIPRHTTANEISPLGILLIHSPLQLIHMYSSPDIIWQIKSRRMRWARHIARMAEMRKVYRVLVGKPEGKNHLEDRGADGRKGS